MTLETLLTKISESHDISVKLIVVPGGACEITLGDPVEGILDLEECASIKEAVEWLEERLEALS